MKDFNFKMGIQAERNTFVNRHAGKIIFACMFLVMSIESFI